MVLHSRKKEPNLFKDRPQSNIAESYRSLGTNLNFYLKNKEQICILISSSITGEGKSFTALNIAGSYAALGNKTVLVNCDIRKSTQLLVVEEPKIGLSTFLSGTNKMD